MSVMRYSTARTYKVYIRGLFSNPGVTKKILLNCKGKEGKIYEEVAKALVPYRDEKPLSTEFVVEGTLERPIISLRYPGRKLVKLHPKRKNAAEYGNLFDFVVVIYQDGKEMISGFTFENLLHDFQDNKKRNDKFWELLKGIYYYNRLLEPPPKLQGIDSELFLLAIKWIWIQEDFNYKLRGNEVNSPIKYKLLSRRNKPMSRGAGRGKFYAALVLLKHSFTIEEVKKIIPMYA